MARGKQRTTTAAEEAVPMVTVQWLVSTSSASHEHGCSIGPRRYGGRAGQRAEVRADDAEVLVASHFARYAPEPEQVAG